MIPPLDPYAYLGSTSRAGEPETTVEAVRATVEAEEWPLAFPATIAARLHDAIDVRSGERINIEEWIAVAKQIGAVTIGALQVLTASASAN